MENKTLLGNQSKDRVKKPTMYRVILLNDDYTTMEFVVEVLVKVFHKNPSEATRIMLDVHQTGKGIVGLYTYDIARTKIYQVEQMAKHNEYPLRTVMEEE